MEFKSPSLSWTLHDINQWAERNGCTAEPNHCGLSTLCIHGAPSAAAERELRNNAPAILHINVHVGN